MIHRGACHCETVKLALRSEGGADDLPIRACACDHCRPQRARYTSDPAGHVTIEVAPGARLHAYRFGTGTADFLRCPRCGFLVGAVCRIEGARYAVLSAGMFPDLWDRPAATADFEGEGVEERLARRSRTWTPATLSEDALPRP